VKALYALWLVLAAGAILWFIVGRWSPSEIKGLQGGDPAAVIVTLDDAGKGTLTRDIGDRREVVQVAFGKAGDAGIAPDYELRVLTAGPVLHANLSLRLMADPRGPDVLLCQDCARAGLYLPTLWRILRE
jgi:hypothetical protein